MYIEWNITKERGNLRPVLQYRVRLEDHEKALALPGVSIESTIPKPDEEHMKYCYPGVMERADGWQAHAFHTLEAPSHVGHPMLHTLTLPWRSDNDYPEVQASFGRLRDALEREIERASKSEPMDEKGSVRASMRAKKLLAPDVAAVRFLRLAREQQKSA